MYLVKTSQAVSYLLLRIELQGRICCFMEVERNESRVNN